MSFNLVQHRQRVLNMYREFLRLSYDWPKDVLRPNRDFRTHLHKQIVTAFNENSELQPESEQVQKLLTKGDEQLEALQNLLDNKYRDEHSLSDQMLNPASNPQYYKKLLSSLSPYTYMNPWKAIFSRLFGSKQ